MIVVTGAAGFIGSCMAHFLNINGHSNLVLVDEFNRPDKLKNYEALNYLNLIERSEFDQWFQQHGDQVKLVFHLGARTDTTEKDNTIFDLLNYDYSKMIWSNCTHFNIPLIYASSAATYGLGEFGYKDDHDIIEQLKPLNPYGVSKNQFDIWALKQVVQPPAWFGLKFFNVYGPNEYHKGRMASVILHAFKQIKAKGSVNLFRSHREDYENGMQLRDFIYVKDLINVCYWLSQKSPDSGLYNLGTGKAEPFLALAQAVFKGLNLPEKIFYIDTPEDIRDTYQYFTEADMNKLKSAGYPGTFMDLSTGAKNYVEKYLLPEKYFHQVI